MDVNLNGKTVLITGGAGFIGSNLALGIQTRFPECRIVLYDAFVLGHFRNLRGFRGQLIAGDIASASELEQLAPYRFDCIFHQAAISDTTVTDQKRVVQVNTNALRHLLELAAGHSAPLVYASSAAVYGNSPPPHRVGRGEAPENVYGFSKLMMDHLAMDFHRRHGTPVVGLRYFNVYGPGEAFKGRMASMVLQLGRQLLGDEPPRLFKHGQQKRDFVYVQDVVRANLQAAGSGAGGVFNIGSGRARTFNELFSILQAALGTSREAQYIDNPWDFYQNHTEADIGETESALGYQPQFSLESGVPDYAPEIRKLAEGRP